jgi:trehalose-6-phosphatase
MMEQRIHAMLSDYDGTLVPTADVKNPKANTVAKELEQTLNKVSSEIPICVISTKDFEFLKNKTIFARVLSCMMGIEALEANG